VSKCVRRFLVVSAAALLSALVAKPALAQDPAKVAPNNYKVVLDNDTVRVCEVTAKAGEKIATHSHPDHMVYAVTAGKIKFTYPDGKTKDVEMKAGDAQFIKAETHATENIGAGDLKVVVVELKKPAPAMPSAAKIPDADDQAKSGADSTKVALDNARVRVLDTRVKAGGKLAKHSHPTYVTYLLTDTKYKVTTYPDGKTEEKTLKAGQATFMPATSHAIDNIGTGESHVLVIELKD
jgi:beta-alanine degradation protein BauB